MAAIDGNAVRIIREKDGASATEFARRLDISLTYLGDIEAGRRTLKRNPALRNLIAEQLNVPTSMVERRIAESA